MPMDRYKSLLNTKNQRASYLQLALNRYIKKKDIDFSYFQ